MIYDSGDELRQLLLRRGSASALATTVAPLVVVSGGRRHVGTTTMALNLAVAFARQGRRAVYVDADLVAGGTRSPVVSDEPTIVDVLDGRSTVHEVLRRGPSGIQVLPGCAIGAAHGTAAAQARLIADLELLAPHAEVVIVDAGGGRNALVRRLWHAARAVLVATTTDDTTVMHAYAAIKTLLPCDRTLPIHTVVNAASGAAARDVHARLAEACRRFLGVAATSGVELEPCEPLPGGPAAVFPPRTAAAQALDRYVESLWAELQVVPRTPPARQPRMVSV